MHQFAVRALCALVAGLMLSLVGALVSQHTPLLSVRAALAQRRAINYTVQPGDTLARIARRFGVSVTQLRRFNNLKSPRIRVGQRLRLVPTRPPDGQRGPYLHGGVMLPEEDGWIVRNPGNSYATPHTVAVITEALECFRERHPDSVPVLIGDLSREKGGWFPPHRSHRDGRDVDIGLLARGNEPLEYFAKLGRRMDVPKMLDLIESFLETGEVEYIFLDWRLQAPLAREAKRRGYAAAELATVFQWPRARRVRVGIIRHSPGHDGHMHVRIRHPEEPRPET